MITFVLQYIILLPVIWQLLLSNLQLTFSALNIYKGPCRGSVSCPRTLRHADGEEWGLNRQPSGGQPLSLSRPFFSSYRATLAWQRGFPGVGFWHFFEKQKGKLLNWQQERSQLTFLADLSSAHPSAKPRWPHRSLSAVLIYPPCSVTTDFFAHSCECGPSERIETLLPDHTS